MAVLQRNVVGGGEQLSTGIVKTGVYNLRQSIKMYSAVHM